MEPDGVHGRRIISSHLVGARGLLRLPARHRQRCQQESARARRRDQYLPAMIACEPLQRSILPIPETQHVGLTTRKEQPMRKEQLIMMRAAVRRMTGIGALALMMLAPQPALAQSDKWEVSLAPLYFWAT